MPYDTTPLNIVVSSSGRRVDIAPLIKQLYGIDYRREWNEAEGQIAVEAVASKIIAATGSTEALDQVLDRLGRRISADFRAHLRTTWATVAARCG